MTLQKALARCVVLLVALTLIPACATHPRKVETPEGPGPGDQTGPFVILGVLSRSTSTLRRADAKETFEDTVTVNVPPGTELIVPAVRTWVAGFGSSDPEDLSTPDTATFTWNAQDHHFGVGLFNVWVKDINAVDTSTTPPTQTATIGVSLTLSDKGANKEWFGGLNYNLICLGRTSPM